MQVITLFSELMFYLACPATRCITLFKQTPHLLFSRVLISSYIHNVMVSTDVEQRQNEVYSLMCEIIGESSSFQNHTPKKIKGPPF